MWNYYFQGHCLCGTVWTNEACNRNGIGDNNMMDSLCKRGKGRVGDGKKRVSRMSTQQTV